MTQDADTSQDGGKPLKVAVIGCGTIGPRHAQSFATTGKTELVGAADIVPERAAAFAERFATDHHYSSATDLLREQSPDIVSIATPPGTHADLTVEVLESGASVLLEKPPSPTLAEMDVMAQAEERSSGTVYAVFQHRHGSGARRAHKLITEGWAGQPLVAVCETLWFRPDSYFDPDWRGTWVGEGGGPTLGHGIHQFDLLLHLLGPWSTITATTSRVARPVEFEDVSVASVVFESGAVASVINSLLSPKELSRIRIDLTGGTLEVNHVYGYTDADWTFSPAPGAKEAASLGHDPGVRDVSGRVATSAETDDQRDPWERTAEAEVPSNHEAQITRLVDDLRAGREHETTLASGRPTMEFITALYASSLQGRTVRRDNLTPENPFYGDLSGGLSTDDITARMTV